MTDFYSRTAAVTGERYRPNESLRHTEIATFMRAPLADSLEGVDIGLIGVPFDLGVTHRAGARHGPREIRNQSTLMRNIHHVTRVNPYERCRIADLGDVRFTDVYHLDRAIREIEQFYRSVRDAGVTPLTAGGDHSIVYPILQALSAGRPLGLVHIDAHLDTWPAFMGSTLHHGAPFRLAVEAGAIDPKRTIQIGIRGAQNIAEGWNYSRDAGMRVVFIEELLELGIPGVLAEVRRVVGNGPTYVTFDIDSLDPAFAPGTGTPEVGGLSTREAQALIRGLAGLDLVGADVVEVAPAYDPSGVTALAGAKMMFELICLLDDALDRRPRTSKE
jgi:guanidinopropionase